MLSPLYPARGSCLGALGRWGGWGPWGGSGGYQLSLAWPRPSRTSLPHNGFLSLNLASLRIRRAFLLEVFRQHFFAPCCQPRLPRTQHKRLKASNAHRKAALGQAQVAALHAQVAAAQAQAAQAQAIQAQDNQAPASQAPKSLPSRIYVGSVYFEISESEIKQVPWH